MVKSVKQTHVLASIKHDGLGAFLSLQSELAGISMESNVVITCESSSTSSNSIDVDSNEIDNNFVVPK